MSNYTKNTNFTAKDTLTSGDPAKVIKGAEFDTEFNSIQTAVNSKADSNNSQLTGTTDAQAVETTGDVTVGGNLSVTGNATIEGNLTFGNADTDTVSFVADVDSSIIPDDDNTYDLGSATKQWRNVYVDGTANIDSLVADTADINGGTIDGVSISGSTASFSGEISANGGIALGDNDKATFGASDDLQIYHDGSNSIINEGGTGDLKVQANKFVVQSASGADDFLLVTPSAGVDLRHNTSGTVGTKLATTATGVDVTGTITADAADIAGAITADGLTVETGSGNTYPSASTSADDLVITNKTASTPAGITIFSDNASQGNIFFGDEQDADVGRIVYDHDGNANTMSLCTNGSERMRINALGYVGIGETDPNERLHINGTLKVAINSVAEAQGYHTTIQSQYGDDALQILSCGKKVLEMGGYTNANTLKLYTADSERARIDSSGNLLVGKTSTNTINTVGHDFSSSGYVMHTRDSSNVLYLNRKGSDGEMQEFYKDGIKVGSIGTRVGDLMIGSDGVGLQFVSDYDEIIPRHTNGNNVDATLSLGGSTSRFKDMFLSGKLVAKNTTDSTNDLMGEFESGAFSTGESTTEVRLTKDGYGLSLKGGLSQGVGALTTFNIRTPSGTTERMRLNGSGELLINTTTGGFGAKVVSHSHTSYTYFSRRTGTGSEGHFVFSNANGAIGTIFTNGSTTSYNTSSDERLKENIQDTTHNVDINDIQVREFDWKADGEHQRFGFIAQELETVYPEAVSTDDSEEQMKSVDYSKLVPLLVKEIQTLKAEIEELKK